MAYTVEGERLKKLREEEAALEAQLTGAEQEESVLDDEQVISPEESLLEEIELTDDIFSDETVPKDATVKPTSESDLVASLRKELADSVHRFNRFKGSSDRTTHGLRTEVASLHTTIAGLRKEIASERSKPSNTAKSFDDVFTQEVKDVLGDEQVDAIRTVVERSDNSVQEIKDQFDKQQVEASERAAKAAAQANLDAFMNDLNRLVPDLAAMNDDPAFNKWLRQPGPDGIERLTRLRSDQTAMDSHRVAQFFTEYKDTIANNSTKRQVKDTVNGHIGPKGTQSSNSNESKDNSRKGFIKQSEINQFQRDVAKGKYKYDAVKADAMEMRIFNAMSSDKIVFDEHPIN